MKTAINTRVFREYDIRGEAKSDLTDEFALHLGHALATHLWQDDATTIAVGRDCRLTSPRLFRSLVHGIRQSGANVLDIGVVTTPQLYFAAFHKKPQGSVIITGSHNPSPDNGFKMLRGTDSIYGDEIRALQRRVETNDYRNSQRVGALTSEDITDAYLQYVVSTLRIGSTPLRVVVDAGNGTGGPTAVRLYEKLGFEVIPLFCEMDGNFPNHHPDPTVKENLQHLIQAVTKHDADLGIALDGDADRLGAVDKKGRILWGDQLLTIFGRALLKEVPGATIIGEVKCSQALYDELALAGGKTIMSKVGHSLIKAKMKETNALLAGEMSGHIFFGHRFLGFDDGVYAGARLLEILSNQEEGLSEIFETLPTMINTPEIRIPCPDEIKFSVVAEVTAQMRKHKQVKSVISVDGVRAHFGDGWGLVRASNTQPNLVLRCEAENERRLAEILNTLQQEIQSATTIRLATGLEPSRTSSTNAT